MGRKRESTSEGRREGKKPRRSSRLNRKRKQDEVEKRITKKKSDETMEGGVNARKVQKVRKTAVKRSRDVNLKTELDARADNLQGSLKKAVSLASPCQHPLPDTSLSPDYAVKNNYNRNATSKKDVIRVMGSTPKKLEFERNLPSETVGSREGACCKEIDETRMADNILERGKARGNSNIHPERTTLRTGHFVERKEWENTNQSRFSLDFQMDMLRITPGISKNKPIQTKLNIIHSLQGRPEIYWVPDEWAHCVHLKGLANRH